MKDSLLNKLAGIVGEPRISTNQADLYVYSFDLTPAEPGWPEAVVMPRSLEELQDILRLLNREKIAVTPYVAGDNIGGLTIPLRGGIVLDLRLMNRILEVNDTDMYAVVEPGVTFGQIKAYLDQNHPNLMYTYAFSPPTSCVMSNAIVQGLDNLSFRYGAASHWVSGLEAMLASGELVRIGSCAASRTWQSIAPFPELSGLFLGWQGSTGIITKMAVSLWPKPPYSSSLTFIAMDLESAYEIFQTVSRTRIPDDLIGSSFALTKISRLALERKKAPIYPAQVINPGEPEFIITAEISGNTQNEIEAKVEVIGDIYRERLEGHRMTGPYNSPTTTAGFPMQALPVLSGGGGLNWVGAYGPMSRWLETAKKGCELQDKYGITRSCYSRIMNEGHFAGLRWMLPFDKGDPEMVRRVKDLSAEQLDLVLETGYIPYKTPVWAIRELEKRVSPAWLQLHRRIKDLLDPNNIMNPGRWGDG